MEEIGLGLSAKGADAFEADLERAQRAVDEFVAAAGGGERELTGLGSGAREAGQGLGELARQSDNAARGLGEIGGGASGAAGGLGELGGRAQGAGGLLSNLGGVISGPLLAGLGAIVGAAGAAGAALLEAGERAKTIRANLGDLPVEEVQAVDKAAALLAARYGADLNEVTKAASALQKEFGLSAQDAMNFVVSGFERGLNASDDFLDTIGEYSNQFSDLGAAPAEFFSILETGLRSGVLGTDKAADAFKEFNIRIKDGSATTADALKGLGLDDVMGRIRDGSMQAIEAFPLIQDALKGIKDPVAQAQLGVALFGTQWEDLGASAVLGIDLAKTNINDLADTSEAAFDRFDSFGEIPERAWSAITTAMMPASDALLGFVNDVWPSVQQGLEDGAALIGDLFGRAREGVDAFFNTPLGTAIKDAASGVADYLQNEFGADVAAGIDVVKGKLDELANSPFGQAVIGAAQQVGSYIVNDLPGDVAAGIDVVRGKFEEIAASPWGQDVQAGAQIVVDYFSGPFQTDISNGVSVVQGKLDEIANSPFGETLKAGAQVVVDYFSGPFQSDLSAGVAVVQGKLTELANSPWGQDVQAGAQIVADYFTGEFATNLSAGAKVALDELGKLGSYILNDWPGDFQAGAGAAMKFIQELPGKIAGLAGEFTARASNIGGAIIDGIKEGLDRASGGLFSAIRGIIQSALGEAEDSAEIQSPSQLFADEVGRPIVLGIAQGMLDNMSTILDAASEIGPIVLEEATALAQEVEEVLGPLLAEGYAGAADFARAQMSGLSGLDALFEVDDGALAAYEEKVEALAEKEADLIEALAKTREKAEEDMAKTREKAEEDLADLAAERARLEQTAATNIDPRKREEAQRKLLDLAEKEEATAEKLAEKEEATAEKLADLAADRAELAAGAEGSGGAEQQAALTAVAEEAERKLEEARQAAMELTDPAEQAAYYRQMQAFILEEANLRQAAIRADTDAERERLERRLGLLQEAQANEFALYEVQADARQRQREQEIREAQNAIEQLGNFVYYTQEDVYGAGDAMIQGIASGIRDGLGGLSETLRAAFESVIADARTILGIASPSRVFADEIGRPLAAGLAAGFANEVPRVEAAIGASIDALVRPIASATSLTSQSQTTNLLTTFAIDARGAAPGVGAEVRRAVEAVVGEKTYKAAAMARMAA